MAQLDNFLRGDLMKGVAIGLGVAVLVPAAIIALAPVIRPMARSTMKAGILAYEKAREAVAEMGEVVDDLVAEVQEELQDAREAEALAATQGPTAEAAGHGDQSA